VGLEEDPQPAISPAAISVQASETFGIERMTERMPQAA
jgi:hypothetical protein